MDYEGQICRAPMERAAYKLPIMVGCCYNQCRFCDLFKHLKFRIIPIEEGKYVPDALIAEIDPNGNIELNTFLNAERSI